MELLLWGLVFAASLGLVVKGADWFLDSAEKIGVAVRLSSFVIGVVIVGLGTSLPELVSALAAVWQGAGELVAANVVGSNIANILLIVGLSAAVGGKLAVSKNLIDLDIPLLTIATAFGVFVMSDGVVMPVESVFLLASFIVFLIYSTRNGGTIDDSEDIQQLFSFERRRPKIGITSVGDDPKTHMTDTVTTRDLLWLVVGLLALVAGGRYLVESVVQVSAILNIGVGAISLVAVAIGTSLPELAVSIKAALAGKHEVALGNIFGSNVFNILLVLGLPGLFAPLVVDDATLGLGMMVMVVATVFFIISGMSKRIHSYEGALYLMVYGFFVGKLFGFF
jgi:cation:H+ antiporter